MHGPLQQVQSRADGKAPNAAEVQVDDTATGQYYFKVDMAIVLDFTGESSSASSWLGDLGSVGHAVAGTDFKQYVSSGDELS